MRRLIHIKNKELKHMKSLAATILTQRTETEQFFLEALQEVKEVVAKERKRRTAQETKALQNKLRGGGGTSGDQKTGIFPPLNIKSAHLHMLETKQPSSALQLGELDKVSIQDLSWEDKELVLRVLFSKMNGVQPGAAQGQRHARNFSSVNQHANHPVFISEGALLPASDDSAARYQSNFEVLRSGVDYEEDPLLRASVSSDHSSFVNDSATLSRQEEDEQSV